MGRASEGEAQLKRCVFCAHRANRGADSPLGRLCDSCIVRLATHAQFGGEVARACWGVVIQTNARGILGRLVEEELAALGSRVVQAGHLEDAIGHLEAGRAADAVETLGRFLSRAPDGPDAERALSLLLGPLLKPGGEAALRAALFRT